MAQINTTVDGASAKPMVRIEGLRKSFGDLEVLRDVNLDIMPGEVVTIIGASGSGKSTLLRCINLLETPDAGHVWFQGSDLTADHVDVNKLREDIGMVFQGFNLFNNMDVLDNCTLAPVTLKKATKQEAEQTAMHHLESVGLADFAHAAVAKLSGGQKQRVAIARALAARPRLLLLDEPTSALDPEFTTEVLDVVRDLAEVGTRFIIVTHEMGFARHACDHVAFLYGGRLLEYGAAARLFDHPETPELTRFLSRLLEWSM